MGHAFAALEAARCADSGGFLLRIEDLDQARARSDYEQGIYDDLRWLGLDWPQPVMRQSARLMAYRAALRALDKMGVLYPCCCRRADIREALRAPQEGAMVHGPDGVIYPGTCRGRAMSDACQGDVIRLDAARAFDHIAMEGLEIYEECLVPTGVRRLTRAAFLRQIGDVVLERRGMGGSYHLAVVVDDAAQGITLVTRGADLFEASWIHVLLQKLLGLPQPRYHHHRLIRDEQGKRLAKRDNARALAQLRAEGATPGDIRAMIGL